MDEWIPLDEARARLGLHPDTLRRQIRRGGREGREGREGRKDNHGRWLVRIDPGESGPVPGQARSDIRPGGPDRGPDAARMLAGRDVQLARLEERLAAAVEREQEQRRFAEAIQAELRRQVEQLRTELERERARAEVSERARTERERALDEALRQLGELRERRPWPGLAAWWRRVIYGEG